MGLGIGGPRRDKQRDLVLRYFPILQDRQDQKAGTMSGGEQQQLAIGRALIGNPDLMLLDEPSEGIQPSIVAQMRATSARSTARSSERAVRRTEHRHDPVLAQRCYVMDKGRIVDQVAPEQLADDSVVRKYLHLVLATLLQGGL